ncbi:MAG: SDR family oxidoreductase [Bacteroidota bacterium]
MPIKPTVALAYSIEDHSFATSLEEALQEVITFQHFQADDGNDDPILSDSLSSYTGFLILLISDSFLRNPNCMLHANRLLSGGNTEAKAVLINGNRYDEQIGEMVEVRTNLSRQSDVMHYINHWQARYLDLRRQRKELEAEIGPKFSAYLAKIREVSGQVNDFLHYLKDSIPLRSVEFEANYYQQLFIFIEEEGRWERYRKTRKAETKEASSPPVVEAPPVDLSSIPGMDQLHAAGSLEVTDEEELEGQLPEEQTTTDVQLDETTLEVSTNTIVPPVTNIPEVPAVSLENSEDPPIEEAAAYIRRAWEAAEQGELSSSLELIKSGRDAMPESKELHYHHALLLAVEAEDLSSARQQLSTLLAVAPDYPDALFLSGELFVAEGAWGKARDTWEKLADLKPNYPDLNQQLGFLIADQFPEDAFDAASYLRRATKMDDQEAEVYYRYALLLSKELDRPKKAIKMLRKAIAIDPTHAAAHYELALRYHAQASYPAALEAYRTASNLDPSYATETNEKAFAIPVQGKFNLMTEKESGVLSALKDNIAQLEAALQQREEEANALAEAEAVQQLQNRPGHGKTVLISGATSGIGLATARRFAAAGYRLIITGRRADRLEVLQTDISDSHEVEVHTLNFDVRDRASVLRAISNLPEGWDTIDILINNAGKAKGFDPIHQGNLDHWDEMIDTNLKGLLYLTRAVSPLMVARGNGFIINLCSTAGKEVYPNGNVYCATKHAVDALTESMRIDLVKHSIRVGQVCPAHVEETEFALVRFDGDAERAASVYENFNPLTSWDVAETVYFMASQPEHVNILDIVLQGKQQASSTMIDRSGRHEEE